MKGSDYIKDNYLRTSQFYSITVVCLACFLLTFVNYKLSTILGIVLAFWLVMRGRPDGILGLFLLYFFRYYFYSVSSPLSPAGAVSMEFRETFTLAGFPLGVATVVCGFVSLRVFLEQFLQPETYRSKFLQILFILWLAAFVPVLIGFYLGYQTKNPNWTRGLRFLMITGSYFYGYILAEHWPKGRSDLLINILVPLVFIMLLLMNLGVYWSHHGFLFLGLGGAFSIYFFRKPSLIHRFLGAALFCLSAGYAVKGSFTMIGITSLSIFLAYLSTKKRASLIHSFFAYACGKRSSNHKHIVKLIGGMAIFGILCISAGISTLGYHPDFAPSLSHGSYVGTISERFEAKLLSDRLPFWHPALKQIIENPYFIVPSGKPLLLNVPGMPAVWVVGCHNTVLEILRLNGLFAGTVMLIILFFALNNNLLVLTKSDDPVLKCLAAGVLSIGIIGMTTGDFPADQTVGVWLWSLAGLGHGLFLQRKSLSRGRQEPFRPTLPIALDKKLHASN